MNDDFFDDVKIANDKIGSHLDQINDLVDEISIENVLPAIRRRFLCLDQHVFSLIYDLPVVSDYQKMLVEREIEFSSQDGDCKYDYNVWISLYGVLKRLDQVGTHLHTMRVVGEILTDEELNHKNLEDDWTRKGFLTLSCSDNVDAGSFYDYGSPFEEDDKEDDEPDIKCDLTDFVVV